MRIPDDEIKELFTYLDRRGDGYVDYDEFCDIIEERKAMQGTIEIDYDPVTGKAKQIKRRQNQNPHLSYFHPDVEPPKFDAYVTTSKKDLYHENLECRSIMSGSKNGKSSAVGKQKRSQSVLPR